MESCNCRDGSFSDAFALNFSPQRTEPIHNII